MSQPPPSDPSNPFQPPSPEQELSLRKQPTDSSSQEQPQFGQPHAAHPQQYGQQGQYAPQPPTQYGQPQFGQPFGGQPQPPYGAPPPYAGQPYGGQPPYPPPRRETGVNGLAIAAFVLGLIGIGVVLAIPFGIVALTQIRKRGQRGKGFAIAGLALSLAWIVGVVAVVFAVVNAQADRDSSGRVVEAGFVPVEDLRAGDCLKDAEEDEIVLVVQVVPCSDPHPSEVLAVFDLPSGAYPDDNAIFDEAEQGCWERVTDAAPDALDDPEILHSYYAPSVENLEFGDRLVVCTADTMTPRTGSLLD